MTVDDRRTPDDAQAQVARLLASDDEGFLRGAYQLILGRGIDKAGQAFYTSRLRSGAKRGDIVWELLSGDEAQTHLSQRPDLAGALARSTGREDGGRGSTVADLMRLPRDQFVDTSLRLLLTFGAPTGLRTDLLARLDGGVPRYRVLQDLAQASGQASFPRVLGLDALLARARDGLFPVASSVAELLDYEDEAFVDCAYKTLMGRAPDAAGGSHYLRRLRAGYSRSSVIEGLARSTEARLRKSGARGLRSHCWRYRLANVPPLADVLALLLRSESDSARARAHRMLGSLALRLNALESRLASAALPPATQRSVAPPAGQAAHQDAMIDIQRDNFEREMNALRKMVIRLTSEAEVIQSGKPARRIGRPRRG